MFKGLRTLIKSFTKEPESLDNRWLEQAVFKNSNIQTKIPNRRRAGYQTKTINQEYYNLPSELRLKISDLYAGRTFKTRESLELTISLKLHDEDFTLEDNTHLLLRTHFAEIIGGQRRNGQKRRYDNVIPAKNQNLPEHTIESLNQLFTKHKKGSKIFRTIISKAKANLL